MEKEISEIFLEEMKGHFQLLAEGLAGVNERLDRHEVRFERIENRLDRIEVQLAGLTDRVGRVEGRVDGLEAKVDRLEARLDAKVDGIEAKVDRLESGQQEIKLGLARFVKKQADNEARIEKLEVELHEHLAEHGNG